MTGAMAEALAKGKALLGTWGAPPDMPAKVALALATLATLAAIFGAGRSLLGAPNFPRVPRRIFLAGTTCAAAFLSLFWIAFYLRGGPRIIDATTYFLQGRALSHGTFSWPVFEPSASFRGRFLLYRASEAPGAQGAMGTMGGIFPPGYPLLVAIGFTLGAPMIVGPILAGALVVATYNLARTLAAKATRPDLVEPVARLAAILSVVSATLRYHTADTMSHGATALGIVLALDFALRGRFGVAGLAVGAVIATRPVSAIAIGLVSFACIIHARISQPIAARREGLKDAIRLALGALPGAALLFAWQKALTGSWFASPQRMYYALSDGPPGCFRWGFGAGVGCLFEHGEFVSARLPHGYGLFEALGATLRRLRMHLTDIANFEPLSLLVLVPLIGCSKSRAPAVVACVGLVILHMLAYAPFYFDGNYPGGGARFFADVLPVEHALMALGIARLAGAHVVRGAFASLAFALAGFAFHASFDHVALANRDGGRPMFEPDVLARANVTRGLVFVDTDHGFSLGHDPFAHGASDVVVARLHNDSRDRLLFESLGKPQAFQYHFDPAPFARSQATITPWVPPAHGNTFRFEAEAEWPALTQSDGFAAPAYTESCASGGRALVLTPNSASKHARAALSIPVPERGCYSVVPRVVAHALHTHSSALCILRFSPASQANPASKPRQAVPSWSWTADFHGCVDLAPQEIELTPPSAELMLETRGEAPAALDKITLRKIQPAACGANAANAKEH